MKYYLNKKISQEDIENLLKEKIDRREFDNKFDEFIQKLENLKKDIYYKIENYALNKDLLNIKKQIENKQNIDIFEIKNILEKKADKESVYNSMKLKSDKNEINTILGNKLDKGDLAIILKSLGEKLDKEEFIKYKAIQENENNKNKNLINNKNINNDNKSSNNELINKNINDNYYSNNISIINDIKDINNDVQEMKKNIHNRIDIINTDIERILDDIKNKFESMDITINDINKKILENNTYKNISNLVKKKLDIKKFNSYVEIVKTNLENNFLEISKNNKEKIEELIEDKIKKINNNIEENFSKILEKQNYELNNYIKKGKNDLLQYEIRVQGIINKLEDENKTELKKLKNEFIEKMDEKLITDKFYNLTEETKFKNNLNQITPNQINSNDSLLNSNEKENENDYNTFFNKPQTTGVTDNNNYINNINYKKLKNEINFEDIKEIKDIYSKIEEIKNDINSNKNEFSKAMETQTLINETLCNENNLGRWLWNSGKLKNNFNIIWDTQKINTCPDNYILDNDKSVILINEGGLYEIILGFYNNKKPNIQVLIDNEVVISNVNKNKNINNMNPICSNTIYSGFMKTNRNIFGNGGFRNITGLTIIDFIFLPDKAKLSVFYNGEIGKGFFGLKKI